MMEAGLVGVWAKKYSPPDNCASVETSVRAESRPLKMSDAWLIMLIFTSAMIFAFFVLLCEIALNNCQILSVVQLSRQTKQYVRTFNQTLYAPQKHLQRIDH